MSGVLKFPSQKPLRIGVHLQGGAAFGDWQRMALEAVLKRPQWFEIVYVSGTSAGAMNAAIVVEALNKYTNRAEGFAQARQGLEVFWQALKHEGRHYADHIQQAQGLLQSVRIVEKAYGPNLPVLKVIADCADLRDSFNRAAYSGLGFFMPFAAATLPAFLPDFEGVAQYAVTKALRDLIGKHITHDKTNNDALVYANDRTKLYVNAAETLETGGYSDRVFQPHEMRLDGLMASAALEGQFKPVAIDGKNYVDGGYTANPSFSPLSIHASEVDAVLTFATNRPRETKITPMPQANIERYDLKPSNKLVLHHMFRELVQHAEQLNGPTQHLIVFNHPEFYDWTAKQNLNPHWLKRLEERGAYDGECQLVRQLPFMGVRSTVSRTALEAMAKQAGSAYLLEEQPKVKTHTATAFLPKKLVAA